MIVVNVRIWSPLSGPTCVRVVPKRGHGWSWLVMNGLLAGRGWLWMAAAGIRWLKRVSTMGKGQKLMEDQGQFCETQTQR